MLKRIACLMLCLMFAASAVLLVGCNGEGDESAASEGSSTQSDKDFSNEVKNWGGENLHQPYYELQHRYYFAMGILGQLLPDRYR
ncbi:MAG: hypothetical protein IKM32_06200 [Clostridia bacterium]|nr:hypothetical protein [Clostridia bacterium]